MAEPQKTKGVDKDDGNTPKNLTPEEMAKLAEERPFSGYIPAMFKQDKLDGLEEDHLPYEEAEGGQSPQVTEDHNNADPTYDQQIFDAVDKGAAGKLDKLLSRGGVSPDCRDNQGRTPLIVVAEAGDGALAGVLIRYAADVNAVDAEGETPLMKAAYGGYLDIVELLVAKEAALDMRNNEGLSALEIAQEMGHEAVVAFLSVQSLASTSSIETETSTNPDDDGANTDGSAEASPTIPIAPASSPEALPFVPEAESTQGTTEIAQGMGTAEERQQELLKSAISTNAAEVNSAGAVEAGPGTNVQEEAERDSFEGILDRFTGKSKGSGIWTSPYNMSQNGAFDGLYQSTVDKVASDIKGIIIITIFHAYLLIGYYLLAVFFDNDESLAFSKNPYKDTSINDLAKRDDIPFTRQILTNCIKAAAVDMELRKRGHHLDHLHYEHLLQLGRLKKQEQRLEQALAANENRLTSNELKKRIDTMLGKTTSQDKQIARTLIRQLREFVRLTSDEDVQGFLEEKERSAVLDHTEIAQLLDFSGKFREAVEDSEEMLKQFEANLRNNFVEKQQQKDQASGKVLVDA